MTKNKMMRIASVLLIVTILSTCALSGTFAKYVTTADGTATARVAKWGVVISVEGGDAVFDTEYAKAANSTFVDDNTVISANVDCVVAPGTASVEPFKATLTGESEVAAQFKLAISDFSEICLPAGTYTDYTHYDIAEGYGTFDLAEDYYPVVLTLKASFPTMGYNKTWTGSWADLEAGLNAVSAGHYHSDDLTVDVPAGVDLTGSFELSWAWAFDGNDKADTFLGVAANDPSIIADVQGASLVETFTFTASATQID